MQSEEKVHIVRYVAALVLLVAMLAVLAPGEVHAQSGRGFYLSLELGANFTPTLGIEGDASNLRLGIARSRRLPTRPHPTA